MKSEITSVNDSLCYILQGLYCAEEKITEAFRKCYFRISSEELRAQLSEYMDDARNKLLRLERIFNYLMKEPVRRRNDIITRMIDETHHLTESTATPHLRDIVVINCIETINAYKISAYRTAYLFAAELELDTACDLLQQTLESETAMKKNLYRIAIDEFNKIPDAL